MGEKARKLPFSTDFLSKAVCASEAMTISWGRNCENYHDKWTFYAKLSTLQKL